MNVFKNKLFSYVFAIILAVIAVLQAIEKNILAIFPLICAIITFVKALRMKDE
ncbi:hypothetical protein [Ectobacillus polymachus]|uniref:hypothetical protein n=1 Tax=Ectobacillus polymachus TaxID=1508806 RepID=UPI003A838F8F